MTPQWPTREVVFVLITAQWIYEWKMFKLSSVELIICHSSLAILSQPWIFKKRWILYEQKKINTCLLPKKGPRYCGKPLSSSSTVCALKIACISLKPW